MKDILAVSYKVKLTRHFSASPLLGVYSREMESICVSKELYTHLHSCSTHRCPMLEINQCSSAVEWKSKCGLGRVGHLRCSKGKTTDIWQRKWISGTPCWAKEARFKGAHPISFHLHKILEKAKLIYSDRKAHQWLPTGGGGAKRHKGLEVMGRFCTWLTPIKLCTLRRVNFVVYTLCHIKFYLKEKLWSIGQDQPFIWKSHCSQL